MTKHVQYTLLLYIRKATVYNNYRSFAVSYCSRLAQTVTDFADASHSKSAKSTTTTVLYGIFSSENSSVYSNTVVPIPRGYAVTLIGFVSFADQNHAPSLSDVRLELQGGTLYTVFSVFCRMHDIYIRKEIDPCHS